MEAIQQCYICKEWYDEKVLSKINVPDQTGYVEKPICKGCIREIEERSKGKNNMPLTLEDLTKEELLILCHRWCFSISERDIKMVKHESIVRQARDLSEQAQKEMKEAMEDHSMEGRIRFLEASEKFDKAMKLYDEAGKILEGKE